ncbi:MAG: YolD-like family protein [Dethiobacteria bacterium]|jgi:hypothetical protein|nr:YolD-like family protein [Bacillota bacterium]
MSSRKFTNQFSCSRMLLSEHGEQLQLQKNREEEEVNNIPLFDEQQYEKFNSLLLQSLKYGLQIKVTVWRKDKKSAFIGTVDKINPLSGNIKFSAGKGKKKLVRIQAKEIIDIEQLNK